MSTSSNDVCIVSYARTPIGAFQGSLSSLTATQLGGIAIQAALERAGLEPSKVDEVFFGNVISANLGQAPVTQAAALGGLPHSVPCVLVNKVCASGLKAVMLAAQSIIAGSNDIVVAGGMESMSNAPHLMPAARGGCRLGNTEVLDSLLRDGLSDAGSGLHMGDCAEMCAARFGISRQQQDDHALESYRRAKDATAAGVTAHEVVPVEVPGRRGGPPAVVTKDETVNRAEEAKLRTLRPVFNRDGGTVTAGNASPLSDGAAAVVVARASVAQQLGLPILGRVLGFADANQDPQWFSTSPALAIPKAVQRSGLQLADVQYWEVNEAFSVVDLANRHLLNLDPATVNVHGGSVAMGHPIGASGARVLVTLMNVLRAKGASIGCVAVCNGGGGASALVVESLEGAARAPHHAL